MRDQSPAGRGTLAGRRVVVTRTRHQAGTLSEALRAHGAEVIEVPTIEIIPPDTYEPLDKALRSVASYDWLIVTSANTVRVIGERLSALGLETSVLRSLKIAAVGSSTAAAMTSLGATPTIVPSEYVAESLIASLQNQVSGRRILLPQASVARDLLREQLTSLGAAVEVVEAYQTVMPQGSLAAVRELFDTATQRAVPGTADAITFTSSSTVKNFAALLDVARIAMPRAIRAISIGPVTSATLRDLGWEPSAEASPHDIGGLVEATIRSFNSSVAHILK